MVYKLQVPTCLGLNREIGPSLCLPSFHTFHLPTSMSKFWKFQQLSLLLNLRLAEFRVRWKHLTIILALRTKEQSFRKSFSETEESEGYGLNSSLELRLSLIKSTPLIIERIRRRVVAPSCLQVEIPSLRGRRHSGRDRPTICQPSDWKPLRRGSGVDRSGWNGGS